MALTVQIEAITTAPRKVIKKELYCLKMNSDIIRHLSVHRIRLLLQLFDHGEYIKVVKKILVYLTTCFENYLVQLACNHN